MNPIVKPTINPVEARTTFYAIDEEERIISVGGAWDSFARANAAHALADGAVLQHSLWEYIVDLETRHIYEMLFERVRVTQQPVSFSLRCDSPTLRRDLQMTLSPRNNIGIDFAVQVLKESDRPTLRLLDHNFPRIEGWVTICSWCKQVELPSRHWVEVDEAVHALNLFNSPTLPQLTHGMCPACRKTFTQRWRQRIPGKATHGQDR